MNRNRSLRWSTTRPNNKNTDTQKEEHTNTVQQRNSESMKRLSGHKRKLEDEPNILLKARLQKQGTKELHTNMNHRRRYIH